MSRVLLIGRGPLPADTATVTGFSQLRTAHFRTALQGTGHEVRVALLVPQAAPVQPQGWAEVVPVVEEGPGWLEQLEDLAAEADMIVSAGPYNPGRAACLVAGERPVWADLPGDPFAELHALAAATEGGLTEERIAAAEAAALPVLARADAISVISGPQRHALIGELGAVGRLLPGTIPEVHTLPIAMPPTEMQPPRDRAAGERLVVALSGAFNPWFDDRTAAQGLDAALQARPQLAVVVTGGGLEGFFEQGYARFEAWARAWPDRVSLHGWVPQAELPAIIGAANLGLSLDSPGPEPELGSRTRLLSFIQHGLLPVATARCELAREMAQQGELRAVPLGDPAALTQALVALVDEDGAASTAAVRAAQDRLAQAYAPARVAAPLVAWAEAPGRTQPAALPAAALAIQLAEERDALAQLHASPTWRTLSRLHRLVRRD